MRKAPALTRRTFLQTSAAAAALPHLPLLAPADEPQQGNVIPPPIVITGGVRPLLSSNTARPLRYQPDGGDFVVRNGSEFFNRPIYGPISSFRIDAGDRPEFSLYLPGHGGNLKLGFITGKSSWWAADSTDVLARFRPGRMLYELRDRRLGSGTVYVELLSSAVGSGLLMKVQGDNLPAGVTLAWAFAGASGRMGRRNGDIGCEVEPVSKFFQVRPEECEGNLYAPPAKSDPFGSWLLSSETVNLAFFFPAGAKVHSADFTAWSSPPEVQAVPASVVKSPVLAGSCALSAEPLYFSIDRQRAQESAPGQPARPSQAASFQARSQQVSATAATISLSTSDPYIDGMGPALGMVSDALWDAKQECVMHGCVAWRVALAGWRGPYVLDATGDHDRARIHFRHWLSKQNTKPITSEDPATGPADPRTRLSRKEALLHSNGDLSNNHYDMNMVFIDVLLRHLRWTGDLSFAREVWPALQRHLAWEHRLFRRTFPAEGKDLPLYEAYAAIWASDNLQYSGGGATHSSAYNIFAFRAAAQIASLLGEDPAPFTREADLIHHAMQKLLWLPQQGAYAESKDLMGPQTVYTNPALWTVYHTVDSEVTTPREAWQMVAERHAVLKHIPIHGEGVPAGEWYMLACSDWLPYMWSLTLILLAENMHFALAMWQAGMREEAFKIFKGSLLDSMYMGLCPGDFHMTSALDGHRQEAQRDFGDPTGCTARALVEGLFGVRPNLLAKTIEIRPGFPAGWDRASLQHKDFDLTWKRVGNQGHGIQEQGIQEQGIQEQFSFTSRFPTEVALTLVLPAHTTTLPRIIANGAAVETSWDSSAIGTPAVLIKIPPTRRVNLTLAWTGTRSPAPPPALTLGLGASLRLPGGVALGQIDDPQSSLRDGRANAPGFHTVFARLDQNGCRWSLPISFNVDDPKLRFNAVPALPNGSRPDPVDLSAVFTHRMTEIFERSYAEPRSALCTLSVPDTLLGGWANIGESFKIDDSGLRAAGGSLKTPLRVPFLTPAGTAPNCVLLSYFRPDRNLLTIPLSGHAQGVYLLLTGTTLPQCSRMNNALATVHYSDGTTSTLPLRNPETWWPIEQDYLLDDFLFVNEAPLPPRVSLRTGETRILHAETFKGQGRTVAGGAATIVHLPLESQKTLASLTFEVSLYNIVGALLGVTLARPA